MRCKTCDRELRSRNDTSKPDLVVMGSRGLCDTCYLKELSMARQSKLDKLPQCRHCHRDMRPYKIEAARFPNTVPQYGKSICWTCQQRINSSMSGNASTLPNVSLEEYLAVKRLVKNDPELLHILGLNKFAEVSE